MASQKPRDLLVDSPSGVQDVISKIISNPGPMVDHDEPEYEKPRLYIDLEGHDLSRYGTLSLMTMLHLSAAGEQTIWIVDVHGLKKAAFETSVASGKTLKDILESPDYLKVFFDVRNDADALYAHYGVKLHGVRDIQLMESATRHDTRARQFLAGLARCVADVLKYDSVRVWKQHKQDGEKLWNPDKGGSCDVFDARPLSKQILAYCAGDVELLPALHRKYHRNTARWTELVTEESEKRAVASRQERYDPHGRERARSPWSVEQNRKLNTWTEVQSPYRWPGYIRREPVPYPTSYYNCDCDSDDSTDSVDSLNEMFRSMNQDGKWSEDDNAHEDWIAVSGELKKAPAVVE